MVSAAAVLAGSLPASKRKDAAYQLVAQTDRERILKASSAYLALKPETITAFPSGRSPGGIHDYFSQADYFWPDPKNPDGPYINQDGQSNPDNFNDHRKAMIALSIQMPALAAAWSLTSDGKYGQHACDHLRAWFVTPATRMNPNLEFSQGVHGVSTGRNYGIIDTLHLVEVARAASIVAPSLLPAEDTAAVKDWFRSYLQWMKTSDKGKQERATLNNHATCWALQAAEFARLIGDGETREEVRQEYIEVLLPNQMGADGSFPKELARTKPYSYSIFNFDVMTTLCQSLKGAGADLLTFQLADGRGICRAAAFLYPYLKDKNIWPYGKDVEHFDALPVRSPGLLFASLACDQQQYVALWKTMDPDPTDREIIRNYPVRQPLLWV
jgi:Alginate lyase